MIVAHIARIGLSHGIITPVAQLSPRRRPDTILGLFHINDLSVLMPLAITAAVLIPMTIQIVALKLGISNWVGLPTSAKTNVCKSKGDRLTEARLTAL